MLCIEHARTVSAASRLGSAAAPQCPSNSRINSDVAAFTSAPSTASTWACRLPLAADIPTLFRGPPGLVSRAELLLCQSDLDAVFGKRQPHGFQRESGRVRCGRMSSRSCDVKGCK